jgi:hypothetical protein
MDEVALPICMTSCTRVCQICGRIAEASQQNNSEVTTTAWNDHTAERRSKLGHVLVNDAYIPAWYHGSQRPDHRQVVSLNVELWKARRHPAHTSQPFL